MGIDTGAQFQNGKGLFDIIVRAHGKTEVHILLKTFRGEKKNRAVRETADFPAEGVAVHVRHHDVQQDKVVGKKFIFKLFRDLRNAGYFVSVFSQRVFNQNKHSLVVVNRKNMRHWKTPFLFTGERIARLPYDLVFVWLSVRQ